MVKCELCSDKAVYGIDHLAHCKDHRKAGETDLKHKKCEYPGCKKRPSHGDPITKKACHCANHSLGIEINVVSKRCIFPDCGRVCTYGIPGTSRTHCATHIVEGEIDLVHKMCIVW